MKKFITIFSLFTTMSCISMNYLQSPPKASPLYVAVFNQDLAQIKVLLSRHETNIDFGTEYNCTPLHTAAKYGYHKIIKILLNYFANPNLRYLKPENGQTALHLCLIKGCSLSVRHLLAAGANPNLLDDKGKSCLDIALDKNLTTIAKILVRAGALIHKNNRGKLLRIYRQDAQDTTADLIEPDSSSSEFFQPASDLMIMPRPLCIPEVKHAFLVALSQAKLQNAEDFFDQLCNACSFEEKRNLLIKALVFACARSDRSALLKLLELLKQLKLKTETSCDGTFSNETEESTIIKFHERLRLYHLANWNNDEESSSIIESWLIENCG